MYVSVENEREMTVYALEWFKALRNQDVDLNVLELLLDVEHTVNNLNCPKQREFMVTLYLTDNDVHTIEQASNHLGYSKQWGYKLHSKAVDEITLNLDFRGFKK